MKAKNTKDSFKYATNGLVHTLKTQPNFRIHTAITIIVVLVSFALRISKLEWLIILITILIVLTAELINTAIEETCNAITIQNNPYIRKAKDAAAAAVLLSSVAAAAIGIIIFIPHLLSLYQQLLHH